ncbi:MAG: tRNA (adenosine(37)-N6)-threonylcarbamoyltransferase complex dimerization subunit type 1 TsaB [Candidatus Marinimicrobia bacterium]|nr:tRNA (adenosine(37)-N6)-threonylcarbamoyltransferase complex dimerization subunit type 1 TsaB [Candidatus Neomarinimicrobiota bacterium]
MILAIETSSTVCSIALKAGDAIIEKNLKEANRHSENLARMVQELLTENKVKNSDIKGLLISGGPGSFTGLRIGMSFAKGFVLPAKIPMALVNSMEAFIYTGKKNILKCARPVCVIKSHRDNVFTGDIINFNDSKDIAYMDINEIQKKLPGVDLILTNDETIKIDNLYQVVNKLNASMLINYFENSDRLKLSHDYNKMKLFYGMEYKAKLWKG